ncbi:DUF3265 domain-containing protein [Vibrio aestuarianus]|nr:DUF3265 domain-containing protein [Vibrio aestuarianus]MDE1218688.1 DUF3265 domain-containing protein [Vibrio aestuarianus]MDE1276875.1 DUF3265 domain-containing protein [Vibrio aestuarianus]MDE1287124.1 DUF3265 domain-containing protein [Vibrio aestuarianus]MDE1291359.1 DUF3265 domain-containing protein [Vibrio aestuarianus]MDE1305368.1 DUF3265 domain-containing protein [Vibrio aestuarianus]
MTAKNNLTNNLRVIQHAWHFGFELVSVITVVKASIVLACFTP